MINIYGIYFDDQLIYVGQTCKNVKARWSDHKSTAKSRPRACPKLYAKINKHGADKFSIELLESVNADDADTREQFWIKSNNLIDEGCNVAEGGRVNRGMKRSQQQCQAISQRAIANYDRGIGLASWNGSQAQRKFLSETLSGRECSWSDRIVGSKSLGTFVITMDGAEYRVPSLAQFVKEHKLNWASAFNALKQGRVVRTKGHVLSVQLKGKT